MARRYPEFNVEVREVDASSTGVDVVLSLPKVEKSIFGLEELAWEGEQTLPSRTRLYLEKVENICSHCMLRGSTGIKVGAGVTAYCTGFGEDMPAAGISLSQILKEWRQSGPVAIMNIKEASIKPGENFSLLRTPCGIIPAVIFQQETIEEDPPPDSFSW